MTVLSAPPLTREVLGIAVREGRVPEPWDAAVVEAPAWWADADRLLFHGPRGAVFATADSVTIQAETAADRDAMDHLLYATAARAVLTFQRRYNLHATLVVSPRGDAVAILGASAAGKSTTTVGLVHRGWQLACDDIVEVTHTDDGPIALPVARPIHLSDTVARSLGADPAIGRLLPMGDKRAYAVDADPTPRPLAALVVLSTLADADVALTPVDRLAALPTVAESGDRYGVCRLPEHRAQFLSWATDLTRSTPVWDLRRPARGDTTAAVVDAVEHVVAEAPTR